MTNPSRLLRYIRSLAVPLLLLALLAGALVPAVLSWLESEERYDNAALQEWIEEARNHETTLAELVGKYIELVNDYIKCEQAQQAAEGEDAVRTEIAATLARDQVNVKFDEIKEHLKALGEPATTMYPGLLPLFPAIYRLEVTFAPDAMPQTEVLQLVGRRLNAPVVWDSGLKPSQTQIRQQSIPLRVGNSVKGLVKIEYKLHSWNKWQRSERLKAQQVWQLSLLGLAAGGLALAWLIRVQQNEREREEQLERAERQRLEETTRRTETERQLLEQKVATQAAESHALELKSHLYASIGIMAGSYAHNIKNLLVRPNDLLRRCLESEVVPAEIETHLREVQQTLGTVTERLQQILHTVRRDPSEATLEELDLNEVLRVLAQTWKELAGDRWHLDVSLELCEEPLIVKADRSHLQQAIENLLFNARDATFEMRTHLREVARNAAGLGVLERRQRVIDAVAWRGRVALRSGRNEKGEAFLEVADNGAGMTQEVRDRCTETHFSTKRDNALYQGHSTGMGLGLSFVLAILEHHGAKLDIESHLFQGTTFRARFLVTT